jgi:hypothetical protein
MLFSASLLLLPISRITRTFVSQLSMTSQSVGDYSTMEVLKELLAMRAEVARQYR